ncbi:MAG: hypothetical protein WBQ78_14990, partial [Gammaproteobacteria bacterium]
EEGQTFVFRVNGDTLERIEVVLGQRVGEWQEIRAGIARDALVVARDVAALSDGQVVSIERLPAPQPAS